MARYRRLIAESQLPTGPNGRRLCRFCQTEVPRGRRTFCSDRCVKEYRIRSSGAALRAAVYERDRGVCALCGRDCAALEQELWRLRERRWQSDQDMERYQARLRELALSPYQLHVWEADHIVPVAEGGGECGLENIRTLCIWCHRKVTAELRRRLADRRAGRVRLPMEA